MKGQAAIIDALFFMLICAGASTLLFYTSGLYGASTNRQVITIYNYEYAGTALVSLHYAKDTADDWFWSELKDKLGESNSETLVSTYFGSQYARGRAYHIWEALKGSSPSGDMFLCFSSGTDTFCYPNNNPLTDASYERKSAYTSSVNLIDKNRGAWEVSIRLYY